MTFKPRIWYPIAVVLSAINLVAVGFAAGEPQPWHVGMHAALALAFGLWAQRLRQRARESELQTPLEVLDALDALEAEVSKLRQELGETQERLDFAERVLAQAPESRRMGPQP
jgi:enoyl-[acyl-carrier-protein] reductase (NADH)